MSENHSLWSSGGYTVNNPSAWGPPVPPTVAPLSTSTSRFDPRLVHTKRPHSESDDCDDVFSEDSKDRCSSPTDDCQMGFSRKKRRGIIEKRRRDRINTSLLELRRLVPSAFEKQGSAKLEKAEILQLTVDHLKSMHSKGLDALSYDPHKFAMDYHSIGFRECAAEVARYLVTVEGMDIQDPLRLRLMSHLQCFAAQREFASKQASTPWNYNSYPPLPEYSSNTYDISNSTQHHQSTTGQHAVASIPSSTHMPLVPQPQNNRHGPPVHPGDSRLTPVTAETHHQGHNQSPGRQIEGSRSLQSGYPSHHPYPSTFPQQGYNTSGQVKPYRPWGAEVAY